LYAIPCAGLSSASPNQLEARGDVPPLVRATHLHLDAMLPVERQEVERLERHIAELGERQPALQPCLHRVLGQHVGHGEVLADVPEVVDQRDRPKPIVVIGHHGLGGTLGEVQEPLQLPPDGRDVMFQGRDVEQVPLGRTPGRVADHPRAAPHERNRASPVLLEPEQSEDRDQVPDVQGVGRWVEPDVRADPPPRRQALGQPRGRGMEDAPPSQVVEEARQGRGKIRGTIRGHACVTRKGPESSPVRPGQLVRVSIHLMVSFRPQCRPASPGGSAVVA
jgi:hypothetical protein